MTQKSPYDVILNRHVTEKTVTLQELHTSDSNRSVSRCKRPKYVFIVSTVSTKQDVARAVEELYKERNVKVVSVNTINQKSKPTRHVRGQRRRGHKSAFKKAIVTLEEGD